MAKNAELKTKKTAGSVSRFIESVKDEQKRKDSFAVLEIMKKITKEEPKMWGSSIVGFGDFHFVYDSGREGDWLLTGFSPRKQALTLYIFGGFERYLDLMSKLGKYKAGKSCIYVRKLEDLNLPVLKTLISESVKHVRKKGLKN